VLPHVPFFTNRADPILGHAEARPSERGVTIATRLTPLGMANRQPWLQNRGARGCSGRIPISRRSFLRIGVDDPTGLFAKLYRLAGACFESLETSKTSSIFPETEHRSRLAQRKNGDGQA
jgi:hypothetical protein